MMGRRSDKRLEQMVLGLVATSPVLGFDLVARLSRSAGVPHGDGYALLYTLESRGLIEGEIEPSADGGERRWYSLTTRGHRALSKMQAPEAVVQTIIPPTPVACPVVVAGGVA
jgi:PadR family transcriptional regulator PadR